MIYRRRSDGNFVPLVLRDKRCTPVAHPHRHAQARLSPQQHASMHQLDLVSLKSFFHYPSGRVQISLELLFVMECTLRVYGRRPWPVAIRHWSCTYFARMIRGWQLIKTRPESTDSRYEFCTEEQLTTLLWHPIRLSRHSVSRVLGDLFASLVGPCNDSTKQTHVSSA